MNDDVPSVRRRSLVRGAAWTTPLALTVAPAPAFAASPCVGFSYPAPNATTWTRVSTRVAENAGNAYTANGYTLSTDPTGTPGSQSAGVVLTGPSVVFTAGRTYRISYAYDGLRSLNARDLTLTVSVGGVLQAGGTLTTTGAPDNSSGTRSFDYTPATTASQAIVLSFQFTTPATSNVGDDVNISGFTVACRPAGT